MEPLNIILIVAVCLMILALVVLSQKARAATQNASKAENDRQSQESKLNALRQEVSSLKEDSQRKAKALEEARDNAKKRLRKDAQKGDSEGSMDIGSDSETDRLKRSLSAMESQIRNMKDESLQASHAVRASVEAEKDSEIAKMKEAIDRLEDQLAQAKGETNKRRQNVSKQMAAPVDLTQLPSEVINELSRLFRKNEQHEKMHGILQGKYQLAQERYQELQRRYFAVCRELALVARPQEEVSDEQAQHLAESVVEASDSLSHEVAATENAPQSDDANH